MKYSKNPTARHSINSKTLLVDFSLTVRIHKACIIAKHSVLTSRYNAEYAFCALSSDLYAHSRPTKRVSAYFCDRTTQHERRLQHAKGIFSGGCSGAWRGNHQ
jgi:hypothetical protein